MRRIDKYGIEGCREKFDFIADKSTWVGDVLDDFVNYCNKEIKTVPRIATINTIEEYENALREREDFCVENLCVNCKYRSFSKTCIVKFLGEEIEVER